MATLAELVVDVREALSVDSSYDALIIPNGIKRQGRRLLRDYHFPWQVKKEIFDPIVGQQNYPHPTGFKKELLVQFYDTEDETYGEPLLKREGFTLPSEDGIPRYYWLWNGNLSTDYVMDADNVATTNLIMWYESSDWDDNEQWMLDNFYDVLFTVSVFRLAAEKGKKELAEIFGTLWADDRVALAKYVNELQFDGSIFIQREPELPRSERYPIS